MKILRIKNFDNQSLKVITIVEPLNHFKNVDAPNVHFFIDVGKDSFNSLNFDVVILILKQKIVTLLVVIFELMIFKDCLFRLFCFA